MYLPRRAAIDADAETCQDVHRKSRYGVHGSRAGAVLTHSTLRPRERALRTIQEAARVVCRSVARQTKLGSSRLSLL